MISGDGMVFIINQMCYCCMHPRDDFWHCEHCWDSFHNGIKDKDWLDYDEYVKSGQAKRWIEIRKEMEKSEI